MVRASEERGETLVELMISIMVISIGLVAIVAMMGGSISTSDAHRSMANVEVITRDFGEAIKDKAIQAAAYTPCPTAGDLSPGYTKADWSTSITGVEYWIPDSTAFPNGTWSDRAACLTHYSSCGSDIAACDPGLQRVAISIAGPMSRSDYGHQDATARILTRRGNGT